MQFETFSDFIAMGNHGFYVWLSYGLSLAIILGNLFAILRRRKQILKDIARKERRVSLNQNNSVGSESSVAE